MVRSREYDGPFRYIIIDFVGPQRPHTPRGNEYMFSAVCAWSGWYWSVPCADDTSETAATCLAERVLFDLVGVLAMLGSDRAQAFVAGVVEVLGQRFGMSQVLGSAFHPVAQGAVERPHRTCKDVCKSFMHEYDNNLDSLACIFQWTVRTTLKEFNGKSTPCEIVIGLSQDSFWIHV